MTQAGQDFLPGSQNKQMALVHGRAASENAFFVLLAKTKQGWKKKNPRTWKRRKEGKKEGKGGGGESGMCRGGGGSKIRLCIEDKVQSAAPPHPFCNF